MARWPVGAVPKSTSIRVSFEAGKSKFPVADHQTVHCFNCHKLITGGLHQNSGHAPGRGEWRQQCDACGMITYYDLET